MEQPAAAGTPERVIRPYYEDEAVTLYLGDCRDVLQQLESMSIDHTITDPPYARDVYVRMSMPNTKAGSGSPARVGVTVKGENWSKRQGAAIQKMAVGDIGHIDEMLECVAGHIARLTQRWAIVFSDAESTYRWRSALQARGPLVGDTFAWEGMRYVRTGAWVKPDAMPQMSGDRPAVGFEPCTIVHAQGPMRWNGGGHAALWTHFISKGSERPDHPCPKPEPLMRELVELFTDADEVILDPFAGSGTTLLAAKRLGRRAIGIEVNEQYAEVAAKRLQQGALDLFTPVEPIAKQQSLADTGTDDGASLDV